MTDNKSVPATAKPGGVKEKLKAYAAAHDCAETTVLPKTGITVTYPAFRNHGRIMSAARMAKGDPQKMQVVYLAQTCLFDGEKLTVTDIAELLPDDDSGHLIRKLFGANEGEEGNEEAGSEADAPLN